MTKINRRKAGTHYTRLLDYLKQYGKITSLEAIRDLGNTRLSATIFELRRDGFDIPSKDKSVPNRWGTTTTVSEYELVPHARWNVEDTSGNITVVTAWHIDDMDKYQYKSATQILEL